MAGGDSWFIGEVFQEFCTALNIVSPSVIPCHRQSLGATERRRGLFRSISDHAIGNKKPNSSSREEWGEFSVMTPIHLNSQVRQFSGFAPGKRVFGRTPKMPIGANGNPHFGDFTNPGDSPTSETQWLIGVIHKIRQASTDADFINKLNTALNRRARGAKSEEFFLGGTVFFPAANRKDKGGRKWLGP